MQTTKNTPLSEGFVALALEELGHDPADAKVPGCYAIRCNHPTKDLEALTRRWLDETGKEAPYLAECAEAEEIAYVGASGNIFDRLVDHTRRDKPKVRQATFLKVFAPRELLAIYPDDEPFLHEQQYADNLAHAHESWYVHCR